MLIKDLGILKLELKNLACHLLCWCNEMEYYWFELKFNTEMFQLM